MKGDFYSKTSNPVYPVMAKNGNLYYASNDATDSEIYVVRWQDGKYGLPEKLGFNSPTERDIDPAVARDESFFIFTSPTRKGFSDNDLWVSFNDNGKWNEPVNLGATINSFSNEGIGSYLFFPFCPQLVL